MGEIILEDTVYQDATLRLALITSLEGGRDESFTIWQACRIETLSGSRREFLSNPVREPGTDEGPVARFRLRDDAIQAATTLHQQFVARCQSDHDFTSYLIQWGLESLEES